MKLVRPILSTAAALALLCLISGCGGGSSSSSSTSTSSAALINEGDAICQATDEATASLQAKFKEASNPSGPNYDSMLAELLARLVVIGRAEGEELAAFEPSAKEAAAFERWLAVGREGLGDFEAAARILKKEGQSSKFARIYGKGQSRLTQANEIATRSGFKICGGQRI